MPQRKFTLFHLSLIERSPDLYQKFFSGNRESWIRKVLATGFSFKHRFNQILVWVPKATPEGKILGLIQKLQKHKAHQAPDAGGDEIQLDTWQGAYVIIDPEHHHDGQKVAVENDEVGSPHALLNSLVDYINSRDDAPFHMEAQAIFDGKKFWEFSKEHGDRLKIISFTFIVPNIWNADGGLDKDLKESGKETGAQKIKVTFESEDGVKTQNDRIRGGIAYIERGAGAVTAKSRDGKKFSSRRKFLTSFLFWPSENDESLPKTISENTDRILGRAEIPTLDNDIVFDGDPNDR